jgi:hypothetical protein
MSAPRLGRAGPTVDVSVRERERSMRAWNGDGMEGSAFYFLRSGRCVAWGGGSCRFGDQSSLSFRHAVVGMYEGAKMRVAIEQLWHVLDLRSLTGRSWVEPGESAVMFSVLLGLFCEQREIRRWGGRRSLRKHRASASISLGMTEIRHRFSIFEKSRESSSQGCVQKDCLHRLSL